MENLIPNYKVFGDTVHRLFVVNNDIFVAKAQIEGIPYFDSDLKKHSY